MPTLQQLQYIVTVEKLGHFGRAAEACHVSQPSLSQQIQKVEEEVGIDIFDRLKKPIMATEKGKRFIEQAKVVLQESQRLADISRADSHEVSGDMKLAIIPTLAPYVLPLFAKDFSESYPKVNLRIDELKTESILESILRDELDAAILAGPIKDRRLKETILFYEPFYMYLSKDHPLTKRKKISEDDLDGSDMWLLQDGHCLRTQVVRLCSLKNEKGVFKNLRFDGGNLETLRYLVKRTQGSTLIPELFVHTLSEHERREYVREFETPVPVREVSLLSRKNHWKSDILDALQKSIVRNLPESLAQSRDKKKSHIVSI